MIILPKPQPGLERPNKAIKTPLKIAFVLIFSVFLFLASSVAASDLDDFETYELGAFLEDDLAGPLGLWVTSTYPSSPMKVHGLIAHSPERHARAYYRYGTTWELSASLYLDIDFQNADIYSFWLYVHNCSNGEADAIVYSAYAYNAHFVIERVSNICHIFGWDESTTSYVDLGLVVEDEYQNYIIHFQGEAPLAQVRYSINGGASYSDWYDNEVRLTSMLRFWLDNRTQNDWVYINLDDILITTFADECSDYASEGACEADPSCVWYFSQYLFDMGLEPYESCAEKEDVVDFCDGNYFDCKYCNTTTTCAAESCYWWDDGACHYTSGECGEGLSLQFCLTEGECESAGGFWNDDFCWLSAGLSLTDWDDYYAEYGDYATPSAWISNLASGTGGFFRSIGGFLDVFRDFFDVKDAYAKGATFGAAIPTAFGYLDIINQFCGGFPIAELFLFTLGFMLAIGVFRIVRNLVQLIKFW
jgi:hypothetical protein